MENVIYLQKTEVNMATYTITVNERTKSGRGLVNYLKSLGMIKEEDEPNDTTLKAMADIENGNVTVFDTFEDYLEAVK